MDVTVPYALFGTSVLMIKFPAFACGLITVALLYRVVTEAYGLTAGAVAGAGRGLVLRCSRAGSGCARTLLTRP